MEDIVIAKKEDWEIYPMPDKNEEFSYKSKITKEELEKLAHGHIPVEMEDRWFSYMEDGKLYIHRSWSGNCIFALTFKKGLFGKITVKVTANRDENQYTGDDKNEEIDLIEQLIWSWGKDESAVNRR